MLLVMKKPVVDMANEMKISLWATRNAMEEFKGATAVLATDDGTQIDSITTKYDQTIEDFDIYATAILKGATLEDGTTVNRYQKEI